MTWHVLIDGEQRGPFESDPMLNMIGRGEIIADTYIWAAGHDDWLRAADVQEFAGSLVGAAPQPLQYGTAADFEAEDAPGRLKFGQAFSDGLSLYRQHPALVFGGLVLVTLVNYALSAGTDYVVALIDNPDDLSDEAAYVGLYAIHLVILSVFLGGFYATLSAILAHNPASWRDVFSGFSRLRDLSSAVIIGLLLTAVACLLLVLPGVYVAVGLSLLLWVAMDQSWPTRNIIQASFHIVMTLGWWRCFGLMALTIVVPLLGLILVIFAFEIRYAMQTEGLVGVDYDQLEPYITIGSMFLMTGLNAPLLTAAYAQGRPHLRDWAKSQGLAFRDTGGARRETPGKCLQAA